MKFDKIKKLVAGTGLPKSLSPAYEHSIDKSPDATLLKAPALKMNKKLVKL